MTAASPAAALARALQDKLGTADLADPAVLAGVDGVLGEVHALYRVQIAELEAEIKRRDEIDRYRQACGAAGVLLHDRPYLLPHVDLAAEMILAGIPPQEVRAGVLQMGSLRPA